MGAPATLKPPGHRPLPHLRSRSSGHCERSGLRITSSFLCRCRPSLQRVHAPHGKNPETNISTQDPVSHRTPGLIIANSGSHKSLDTGAIQTVAATHSTGDLPPFPGPVPHLCPQPERDSPRPTIPSAFPPGQWPRTATAQSAMRGPAAVPSRPLAGLPISTVLVTSTRFISREFRSPTVLTPSQQCRLRGLFLGVLSASTEYAVPKLL